MEQDAVTLLEQDHQILRQLLDRLEETSNRAVKTREETLDQIGAELRIHTRVEEEVFYPAFKAVGGHQGKRMFHEAVEEHRAVEELVLPDLERTDPASDQFAGRAKVLKELIEHHVEEEEGEMFPMAREWLEADKLAELGRHMQVLKDRLHA